MGYQRLTPKDRYQIEFLKSNGQSVRSIARRLKVQPSTISRELNRRKNKKYCAERAQKHTEQEVGRRAEARFKIDGRLKKLIDKKIENNDLSPEQVAAWLKKREIAISHHTIYRYVERDARAGGNLKKHLRILRMQRKDRKKPKYKAYQGLVKNRVPIAKRPKIVEKRKRIGDYERDTIMGSIDGAVLLTIVDRKSRYVHIECLSRKGAEEAHRATIKALRNRVVHTITNDNGTEFAFHEKTSKALDTKIYFSRSYAAWERGTNENTNGLLRQYFPRRKPIARLTPSELRAIEFKINTRIRKCLGWRTPYEIYHAKQPGRVLR